MQTLLDGIASRLDETRETSRYLIGVLIFLGLLGTFYGLLETVRSVGGVLGALNVGGSDAARAFADLKAGLESPLARHERPRSARRCSGSPAASSSAFSICKPVRRRTASTTISKSGCRPIRRLSGGQLGDGGDGSMPAYIQALLEQTADSLENLQRILARSEESRIGANATLASLTDRLGVLGEQMKAGQILMVRLAENQLELKPSLTRLADVAESSLGHDDVLRSHLRNIEAYLARLTEDVAQGRAQSVQELRGEIRILARTIAALAEEGRR